jgi:RNA polymerase sigma-70 factor, ECF subfamily
MEISLKVIHNKILDEEKTLFPQLPALFQPKSLLGIHQETLAGRLFHPGRDEVVLHLADVNRCPRTCQYLRCVEFGVPSSQFAVGTVDAIWVKVVLEGMQDTYNLRRWSFQFRAGGRVIWKSFEKDRAMNVTHLVMETTEIDLVNSAAQGNLDAFNHLVLFNQDLAYRNAYAILNDPWLAEEAVQDGFVKAFQSIRGFRGGSFRAWLMRIVTNTVYDMLRRSHRRAEQPLFPEDSEGEDVESPAWLIDPTAKVEEAVVWTEEVRTVYQGLDELPLIYREILTLVDLNDFVYEEAAQALNIPIGTVKSRLARARLYLKEKLQSKAAFGRDLTDTRLCRAI